MMQPKQDIYVNSSRRRWRYGMLVGLMACLFFNCTSQPGGYIDGPFVIDKTFVGDDKYTSGKLDELFAIDHGIYFEPDYTGTSFKEYYVTYIVPQDNKPDRPGYLLFFDSKDILRDTLHVPSGQMVALNVVYEQQKKGIALGIFDPATSYFRIYRKLALSPGVKLTPLPLATRVESCPLPIELLSEEQVGLEAYFHYGTEAPGADTSAKAKETSQWAGIYRADIDISRLDGDFKVSYVITVSEPLEVSVVTRVNDELDTLSDLVVHTSNADSLVLKSKTDTKVVYTIVNIEDQYYLSGQTIYQLNPPNDKYPLKKE